MANMAQIYALSKLFGGSSGNGGGGTSGVATLNLSITNPEFGTLSQYFDISVPVDYDIYNGVLEGSSQELFTSNIDIPIPIPYGESYIMYYVYDNGQGCLFNAAMTGDIEQDPDWPASFRIYGDCTLAVTITEHDK